MIRELKDHKGAVLSLLQAKEGNLISGEVNSLIFIWNQNLTKMSQTLLQEGSILSLYQLKNSFICSISTDNQVKIWGNDNLIQKNN